MDDGIAITYDDFDARDVFVNRGNEREHFKQLLAAHRAAVAAGTRDPGETHAPRDNVMVFYGIGGYGKTRLSHQLEKDLKADALADNGGKRRGRKDRIVTARIDLASGWDFDGMLLCVRAQLTPLRRTLPAFDIAFRKYWTVAHPGDDLRNYINQHRMLHSLAGAVNLPDQLDTALQSAANALGEVSVIGAAAWQVVSMVSTAIRDKKDVRDAVTRCPDFPRLLETAHEPETVSQFPKLLAWELHHLRAQRPVTLVVFLDEFQRLADGSDRDLERFLQRMVWLMPNVFFVITGRDRLDWGDRRDSPRKLDFSGGRSWPGLARGTLEPPRQHLIEELSDADMDRFLQGKLRVTTPDGGEAPLIPEEIRRVIVGNAAGWPECLDVAVRLFIQIMRDGDTPTAADFAEGFAGLMKRIFEGLDTGEQAVIRAVSLLEGFDVSLAAAAAGVTEGTAASFVGRSLVREDPEGFWPYYLSEPVRRQVRKSDQTAGAWTANDWQSAAGRAVAVMGDQFIRARAAHDRLAVINYLNQSLRLAHEYDRELGWLTDAAYAYVEDYKWEPTLSPAVPDATATQDITSAAQALALALIAIRERQTVHRSTTLQKLQICRSAGVLSGPADDLVAYFCAECRRDLGHPEESEQMMAKLIGEGRPMNLQASEGVIYAQRRCGRLREARAGIERLPPSPVRSRLLGDVFWNQASLDAAGVAYADSRNRALHEDLFGQAAEAEASRAFALSFVGGDRARQSIKNARELLGAARIRWAQLQTENAELLLLAGGSDKFDGRYAAALDAGEQAGLSSIVAYAALVGAYDAVLRRDEEALARSRERLGQLVTEHQFRYLLEIVDFWWPGSGANSSQTQWPDGVQATARRWRNVVDARRVAGAVAAAAEHGPNGT